MPQYESLASQIQQLTGASSIVFHSLPIDTHGVWVAKNMNVLADLDIMSKYFDEILSWHAILYILDLL